MRNLKLIKGLGVLVVMTATALAFTPQRQGQDAAEFGPPSWVLDAWETGEEPVVPENGPPDWVVDAWTDGDHPRANGGFGPPPWVFNLEQRDTFGPPAWVIEAWENGGHPSRGVGPSDNSER